MTVTVIRKPYLAVTIAGTPVTGLLGARVQQGYTLQTAQAEVDVRTLPAANCWDEVVITMGGTQATAEVRFTGFFVGHEPQFYDKSYKLQCKGRLQRAVVYEKELEEDMSSAGAGHHDETMVATVLYQVALADAVIGETVPAEIEGTGRMLGKYSWQRGFGWRVGESGIAFIQRLDAVCLGYRTFDTADGTIVRQQISTIPVATPDFTFEEGVDIYRASGSDEVLQSRNRVVVEGFPGWDGKTTISHTEDAANPYLVDGTWGQFYLAHKVSSAMIEKALTADTIPVDGADPTDGLSCEEVATWLLGEMNRRVVRGTLTTPRDDLIVPGSTIQVTSPTRLGVNQKFWLQQIDTAINRQNQFMQTLAYFGSHAFPVS